MASWPSISNPDKFQEETYRPAVRTEFEANYVQTRVLSTRSRGRWVLGWKRLTNADYATLKTFFEANQGLPIDWTHFTASSAHTVIFSEQTLRATWASPGFWNVETIIEEL